MSYSHHLSSPVPGLSIFPVNTDQMSPAVLSFGLSSDPVLPPTGAHTGTRSSRCSQHHASPQEPQGISLHRRKYFQLTKGRAAQRTSSVAACGERAFQAICVALEFKPFGCGAARWPPLGSGYKDGQLLRIPPRRNDAEEVPGSVKAGDEDPQAQLSPRTASGRTPARQGAASPRTRKPTTRGLVSMTPCPPAPSRVSTIQAAPKIVNSTLEYPCSTLDRGSLFPEWTILLSVAVPWTSRQMQQEREQEKEISLSGTGPGSWHDLSYGQCLKGLAQRQLPARFCLCSAPTLQGGETRTKPTCTDVNEAYGNQLLSRSRTPRIKPVAACTPLGTLYSCGQRQEGRTFFWSVWQNTYRDIHWVAGQKTLKFRSLHLVLFFEKGGQKAGKVALCQTGSFTTRCSTCVSLPVCCSLTALQHHGEAVRSPSANYK